MDSEQRLKLAEARNLLKELKSFIESNEIKDFILLDPFPQNSSKFPYIQNNHLFTYTDKITINTDRPTGLLATQNSLKLMEEICPRRLFPELFIDSLMSQSLQMSQSKKIQLNEAGPYNPTGVTYGQMDQISSSKIFGNERNMLRKVTQGRTNLCVSFAAMRLLSYTLMEFLKHIFMDHAENFKNDEKLNDLENIILNFGNDTDGSNSLFFLQLITICCGVISPRALNGLNHCYHDDKFQITAQEQDIRK